MYESGIAGTGATPMLSCNGKCDADSNNPMVSARRSVAPRLFLFTFFVMLNCKIAMLRWRPRFLFVISV